MLGLPAVAGATPQISAPAATSSVPSFTFADLDPSALSFTVSRGSPDCSSLTQIDGNASSPFTDPALLADGSDDGTYCYQVQSFDGPDPGTSNPIDIGQATIVLDTTGPSVSFSSPPANNTRVSGDTDLNAAATDALTNVASVQLQRFNGSTWVDVGAADTSAPFSAVDFLAGSLPDGSYQLRLQATDTVGNSSVSSSLTLILDTVTAATTITAPADASIQNGSFSISFTNSDPATPVATTATARLHGTTDPFVSQPGLDKTGWDTTAGATATSNDGDWDVLLSSQDALGNPASSDTVRVIVDNGPPSLTLSTFPADAANVRATVNATFSASDAVTSVTAKLQYDPPGNGVNWTDATTTPITGGVAWDTTGVADGVYGLRVLATDGAGNITGRPASPVNVKVDNTAPATPTISAPANGATFGLGQISITYTGGTETASSTASGLASVVLQTQNQSQVAGNTWTPRSPAVTVTPVHWTPGAPDDCLCNFRLVATDAAGNTSTSALKSNIRIDGFPPIKPAQFRIDRAITNGPPILTWTASPSGDVVGYRLVRSRDSAVLQGPGGLLTGLNYTDNGLVRDGSQDGANGYELYASDGNNLSPVMTVTFFLDTVAPTTPTAANAARRANTTLVDLSWGASQDMLGNSVMTGVSRYIVRRAVGIAPASPASGEAACDVPVSQLTCTDSTAGEGKTYAYSVFAVDAASNGSLAAHAGSVTIPDLTPPGQPTAFKVRRKGLVMAFTWNLPTAADLNRIVIVRNTTHSPRTVTDGKAVFTGKVAKANVRQAAGSRAWYKAFALDNAGNASASAGLQVVLPVFKLFPEDGSDLTTTKLTWKKSKRASYYNVQVYLGSKRITQAWPKGTSFKLPRAKLKRGKVYTWYVWPGIGAKARGRYGNLIGKSNFTWLG